jgi:hypothetical protein
VLKSDTKQKAHLYIILKVDVSRFPKAKKQTKNDHADRVFFGLFFV